MTMILRLPRLKNFRRLGWPLAIGCLLSGLFGVVALRSRPAQSIVLFDVNEAEPEVFLDGALVPVCWQASGSRNKGSLTVPAGSHKIELKKDGFQSLDQTLNLEQGDRCIVVLKLARQEAESSPADASPAVLTGGPSLSSDQRLPVAKHDAGSDAKSAIMERTATVGQLPPKAGEPLPSLAQAPAASQPNASQPPSDGAAISADDKSTAAPVFAEKLALWRRDYAQRMQQAQADNQARQQLFRKRRGELLELAAEGERGTPPDHRSLASIYGEVLLWNKAAQHATDALQQGPPDEQLFGVQINSLASLGDFTGAENALAKAKQAFPESNLLGPWEFRIAQGRITDLIRRERLDDAEQQLQEAEKKLTDLREQFPSRAAQWDGLQRSLAGIGGRIKSMRRRLELIGQPAIALTGANWLDSPTLTIDELRGKVVLLDFWAVWCGPCIATFPHLRAWHDQFNSRGLAIVGVTRYCQFGWDPDQKHARHVDNLSQQDEEEALRAFVKHHQLKHAIAVTSDGELSAQYTVSGIPQLVVIDRAGKIRMIRVGSGPKNAEDVEKCIRECLAEQPAGTESDKG